MHFKIAYRKWTHLFQHVSFDSTNMHVNFYTLVIGKGKNNNISCFQANRIWKYSFCHANWDYKNMLVNFIFLVLAIFLQEEAKIVPFPVSSQTGNGTINFDMSPGNTKICFSASIFLS